MEGQSCPFTLFPGRKVMPQDVSAACGNAMPPKRNYCLKSTQEDLFPRISYLGNLHHSSKAKCLFGNNKMRCGPKSTIACSTVAESLRRHQRQLLAHSTKGRAGWAGGPAGVCCLCCVLQYWLQSCKVSGIFLLQHKGNSEISFCRGEKEMRHVDCLFCSNWIQTLFLNKPPFTPAPVAFHGCECRGAVPGMGK